MKNLQKLIDERAEKRLDEDISKLVKAAELKAGQISLLELGTQFALDFVITEPTGTQPVGKKQSLREGLWSPSSHFFEEVKRRFLEKYKAEESRLFLKELQDLKDSKEELLERLEETLNYVDQQINN